MGKTILELFNNGDLNQIGNAPGIPIEYNGNTPADKYSVRNSKDIRIGVASSYMGTSIGLLNKLRLSKGLTDPITETFLEEEATGLRPLRTLSIPIIYGTDSVRIIGGSTQDVRRMKDSVGDTVGGGKIANFVSNVGKRIDQISDKVKSAIGVPTPLYPSSFVKGDKFLNGVTNQTPQTLSDIKGDAAGNLIGKYLLQSSQGTPEQIKNQAIGAGISLAKGAIRKSLFGSRGGAGVNQSSDKVNYNGFAGKYANIESDNSLGSYTSTMENYIQSDSKSQYDITLVSPISGFDRPSGTTLIDSSEPWLGTRQLVQNRFGTTKYSIEIPSERRRSADVSIRDLQERYNSPITPHTSQKGKDEPTNLKDLGNLFDNDSTLYPNAKNSPLRKVILDNPNQKFGELKVKIDQLRPTKLKNRTKKDLEKEIYYSRTGGVIKNPYGEFETDEYSLENRRGLSTDRDVLNQMGRISHKEISSIKINGTRPLQDVDIIPLRFQRINDHSAVYLRTILTSFSETFTPGWEGANMVGNPFKFYTYTGIERKVSFNVKVYAMSQLELIMMWRRLEYLAHLTYPYDYTPAGAVEPSLFWLTLGSMYVNKPAILTSLSYNIEDAENLWEIGGTNTSIKKGRYINDFNDKFYVGEDNGKEYSLGKGTGKEPRVGLPKPAETKSMTINTETYQTEIFKNINGNGEPKDINMDEYKLPKFINAQFEVTFLESREMTKWNVYGYGQPITYGLDKKSPATPSANAGQSDAQSTPAATNTVASTPPATNTVASEAQRSSFAQSSANGAVRR